MVNAKRSAILCGMKRRLANLPLHGGKAPPWLFQRMTKLAGAVTMAIVDEFGPDEMLRRLSDPWWFQAFGCVLGFDWHSSGVTTVTCGALKEAAKRHGADLGILVAGGKGGTSRKTPDEIAELSDAYAVNDGERLIYNSRMSAKVDSSAVQDGFGIYHHNIFFTPQGAWCIVRQGMNEDKGWARRYHWLGETVNDFVCEPHNAIGDLDGKPQGAQQPGQRQLTLLNMVAEEADRNRNASAELVREHPERVLEEIKAVTEGPTLFAPARHRVTTADFNPKRLRKILFDVHEQHPDSFQTLLGTAGVGPATIRSLSLLAEIIFDAPASHRDPTQGKPAANTDERKWADYSHAHGGKDGTPFPVDRETYDQNISVLADAVRKARLGENDKMQALQRLTRRAS